MASLRLAEKIILGGWGDIYVIQAVTSVRVHLSVCNVCEAVSGGGQWDGLVEMAALLLHWLRLLGKEARKD